MIKPYQNLANAIIERAVKDYRDSTKALKLKGNKLSTKKRKEHEEIIEEVEKFLRSDRYKILTRVDGEELLNTLQEEVNRL